MSTNTKKLFFDKPISTDKQPLPENIPLWQLTQDFIEVVQLLEKDWDKFDEAEGVDLEHLELALAKLKIERTTKIENCLKLYHSYKARESLVRGEIDRLRSIEDKFDRCASNIKTYLERYIQPDESFNFACGTVGWRASEAVQPIDTYDGEPAIPERFQRVKITPDLAEMKKALKSGETVEGWNLIKRNNIQLK